MDAQDRIADRFTSRSNRARGLGEEHLGSVALLARERSAKVDNDLAVGTQVGRQIRGTQDTVGPGSLDLDPTEGVCIEFGSVVEPQDQLPWTGLQNRRSRRRTQGNE